MQHILRAGQQRSKRLFSSCFTQQTGSLTRTPIFLHAANVRTIGMRSWNMRSIAIRRLSTGPKSEGSARTSIAEVRAESEDAIMNQPLTTQEKVTGTLTFGAILFGG